MRCGTRYYDIQRLGFFLTNSPRHADVLLVTGPVTTPLREPLRRTWEVMPAPKALIAVGDDACGIGLHADRAGGLTAGGVDGVLTVDVYVPGTPPPPIAIMQGLLLAAGVSHPSRWQHERPFCHRNEPARAGHTGGLDIAFDRRPQAGFDLLGGRLSAACSRWACGRARAQRAGCESRIMDRVRSQRTSSRRTRRDLSRAHGDHRRCRIACLRSSYRLGNG